MRHFRYFLVSSLAAFCLLFASCDLLFPDSENETDLTPEAGDNMYMGNPDDAGTSTTANAENYLLIKDGYAVSYNSAKRIPNMVSWHLDAGDLGDADRSSGFVTDKTLPSGWVRVSEDDYTNSGFARGHLCPSADRTSSDVANKETFIMTNVVPQAMSNNSVLWLGLENECRGIANDGLELYIVAGVWDDPDGDGGEGDNGAREWINNDEGQDEDEWVCVPEYLWKVILVMEESDEDDIERATTLNCDMVAVWIPNNDDFSIPDPNNTWEDYVVTVDEVEANTGYNFFENLPDDVEDYLERQVYTGAEV